MVAIIDFRSANVAAYQARPLVAALVGGTSGIGENTARALAQIYSRQGSALRLYPIGRNQLAPDRIISECSRFCSHGVFNRVQAGDLASIIEVDRISEMILKWEQQQYHDDNPRIDMLVLTQGRVVFGHPQGFLHPLP